MTKVAIIQVCVDPRLDHGRIRMQLAETFSGLGLEVDQIFILNEVGGNFGATFIATLELFLKQNAQVVFSGVLHHDDCVAARYQLRQPLATTQARVREALAEKNIDCPVYKGRIVTKTHFLEWL